MLIELTLSQLNMIGCEDNDPAKLDFARRCFYLGYGLHVIHDWMQQFGTVVGDVRLRDVVEVSDLMGITAHDRIVLKTKQGN